MLPNKACMKENIMLEKLLFWPRRVCISLQNIFVFVGFKHLDIRNSEHSYNNSHPDSYKEGPLRSFMPHIFYSI